MSNTIKILRKLYCIHPRGLPSSEHPDNPYMRQSNGSLVITNRGMAYLGNEVRK